MAIPLKSVLTFRDGQPSGRGIPFGSSSVQHGVAAFEGIRCYAAAGGTAIFRLREHLTRLLESARLLGIAHDYQLADLGIQVRGAAAASGRADCYLRPVLFTPDPCLTVDLDAMSFTLAVEVWPVPPRPAAGTTLPPAGSRLTISPWRRPASSSFPPRAKATGIYVTSALAKVAAVRKQCADAIQLDPDSGRVAEATSANVFLVRDGVLRTPWLSDSLLAGITRDSVLRLARELGIPTAEEPVEVADLLAADEVFLTGTASELVPVAAIDDQGYDDHGPVFSALASAFYDAVTGTSYQHLGWLTSCGPAMTHTAPG